MFKYFERAVKNKRVFSCDDIRKLFWLFLTATEFETAIKLLTNHRPALAVSIVKEMKEMVLERNEILKKEVAAKMN